MHTAPLASAFPECYLHLQPCPGKAFAREKTIALESLLSLLNWSALYIPYFHKESALSAETEIHFLNYVAIIFLRVAYANMTILAFLTHDRVLIHPKEEKLTIIQCSVFVSINDPRRHKQLYSYRAFYISTWNQSKQNLFFFQYWGERNHPSNRTSLLPSPSRIPCM